MRLTFKFLLAFVLALAVALAVTAWRNLERERALFDRDLRHDSQMIGRLVAQSYQHEVRRGDLAAAEAVLSDARNARVGFTVTRVGRGDLPARVAAAMAAGQTVAVRDDRAMSTYLPLDERAALRVAGSLAAEHAYVRQSKQRALLSSLADETPEGRSIVVFAKSNFGLRARTPGELVNAHWVEFSAATRMSGVDLDNGHQLRKGAASTVAEWVRSQGGTVPTQLGDIVDGISAAGGTPLVVGEVVDGKAAVLGVIHLKDVVKQGMRERFDEMRRMGIRTVMITGDNPLTAKAIADEAGVDDFLAEATPEDKLALIRKEQAGGKLVAMTGDGTNDAPALAQADVGVAMNTGTQAAKEAGNMVDLDSNPTKLLEVVEVGKQLLMTRGTLTTFSIANDVAKYFAILPAIFAAVFVEIEPLDIMDLASPYSAVLAAVIFNAIIIIALVPLALRGVRYRPLGAAALLRRALLIYGVGGVVVPFVGIKLVDFKLEFGRLFDGDFSRIILADEISPDGCRLWDIETGEKLDKDRFRRDLGGEAACGRAAARWQGVPQPLAGLRANLRCHLPWPALPNSLRAPKGSPLRQRR